MDNKTKSLLMLCGAASVTGALIGLGLSFTALSPLVIGGIVAAVPAILFAAYVICKEGCSKEDLFFFALFCVTSAAMGVGLAAAATAIFPGAMLGMGSAALTGAVIGAIALITAFLAIENTDESLLILCGALGALSGLGLSFTALSPLVVGGIVAAVPAVLFAACMTYLGVREKEFSKQGLFMMAVFAASTIAIGVGLAAAATAIFPGAMLGLGSAALVGATIGVIAPIAGVFATLAIISAAEKVNEYIISPIVECFSSKGEKYKSP